MALSSQKQSDLVTAQQDSHPCKKAKLESEDLTSPAPPSETDTASNKEEYPASEATRTHMALRVGVVIDSAAGTSASRGAGSHIAGALGVQSSKSSSEYSDGMHTTPRADQAAESRTSPSSGASSPLSDLSELSDVDTGGVIPEQESTSYGRRPARASKAVQLMGHEAKRIDRPGPRKSRSDKTSKRLRSHKARATPKAGRQVNAKGAEAAMGSSPGDGDEQASLRLARQLAYGLRG